eukprot:scaffold298_cov247-Pinguiococcus_pyrenoidosus.AAC.2
MTFRMSEAGSRPNVMLTAQSAKVMDDDRSKAEGIWGRPSLPRAISSIWLSRRKPSRDEQLMSDRNLEAICDRISSMRV